MARRWARLELPASSQSELNRYQVHPALLDACLQVMAAAIPAELERKRHFYAAGHRPVCAVPAPRRRGLELSPWNCRKKMARYETLTAQVQVLDDNGRLLAEVSGHSSQASQPRSFAGQPCR
jgi:hypothetical protein